MTQNILIEFTSDASGLNAGIEGMVQLGKLDKDVAATFIKTNEQLKARQALLQSNDTQLQKFIGSLTQVQKAALGDTYSKVLTGIQQQLTSTNQKAIEFYNTIIKTAQADIVTASTQEELQNYLAVISSANGAIADLSKSSESAATSSTNLAATLDQVGSGTLRSTTLLRNMKQELIGMEEQGVEFSTTFGLSFDELSVAASQLQHQIDQTRNRIQQLASGTFAIHAVIESLQGLAAGFNVAYGASVLFGNQNKELEQTMLKVQAAMNLLIGLQQVTALFSEQSTARTAFEIITKKIFGKTTDDVSEKLKKEAAAHLENAAAAEFEQSKIAKGAATNVAETVTSTATDNAPDAIAAANTAALLHNTQVIKGVSAAEKDLAKAKEGTTAATNLETVSTEENTAAAEANLVPETEILGVSQDVAIAKGEQAAATDALVVSTEAQAVAADGAAVSEVALAGATKLATTGTIAATTATAAAFSVSTVLLGAVVALAEIYGVYRLVVGKTTDAEKERKAALETMKEAEEKAADGIAKETGALNLLVVTAKDSALTENERRDAINKMNKDYPEHLSFINLENLYTRQTTDAIAQELVLIQKRALARASEDLYVEKLKSVAEAQAKLNIIQTQGAGYFQKLYAQVTNLGSALTGTSAQTNAEKNALEDVNDATIGAAGALDVFKTNTEAVSAELNKSVASFNNYIDQFNIFKTTVETPITFPGLIVPKTFNKEEFDQRKALALQEIQAELDATQAGGEKELALKLKLAKTEYDKDIERFNATHIVELGLDKQAKADLATINAKFQAAQLIFNKSQLDLYYKSVIANDQAILLEKEKAGEQQSDSFFKASERALRDQAAQQLAAAGITAGEIRRINAQLALDLQNLEIKRLNTSLEAQKNIESAKLDIVVKGRQAELDSQINILRLESQIALNNARGDAELRQKIKADELAKEFEMVKAFNLKVKEDEIHSQISGINANISALQLQNVSATNDQMIALKKQLIEKEAQLEIDGVLASEKTYNQKLNAVLEIFTKELNAKKQLEKDKAKVEIDAALQLTENTLDHQKSLLDGLNEVISQFGPARKKLNEDLYQNDLARIKAEESANFQSLQNGIIDLEEYNKKVAELDKQRADASISNDQRMVAQREASFNFAADEVSKLVNAGFDAEKARLEESAQLNQDLADKKIITAKELSARNKQIQKEEAALEKQRAIFSVLVDFAKNLFKLVAESLINPSALKDIPLLVASELFSIGLIAAAKFKTGAVNIDGPGTETSDSISARISKHESVINAKATTGSTSVDVGQKKVTVRHEDALTAMNEFRFADYLLSIIPKFDMPVFSNQAVPAYSMIRMLDMPRWTERVIKREVSSSRDIEIDYAKMGETFAEHVGKIEDIPQHEWNVDNDGLHHSVIKGVQRMEFLNKKFSSKKSGQ